MSGQPLLRAAAIIAYNPRGVQQMAQSMPEDFFRRVDETDDALFYSFPRFVVHIDEWAIATIGEIFAQHLPQGGVLLDLMSSWRSHLPDSIAPAAVTGLGLNRAEMENNPALTSVVVHDLNRDPRLPFDDASFDGATLTVSVQYLVKPAEVFAEAGRVLRPGAPLVVSFSNRMFPTKVVWVWQQASEAQRVQIVERYFDAAARFEDIQAIERHCATGYADPVYAVIGRRRD